MTLRLADCHWIKERLNILLTGPTGVGKTWLAMCAAHKAKPIGSYRFVLSVAPIDTVGSLARGDGSYAKLMTRLARTRYRSWTTGANEQTQC